LYYDLDDDDDENDKKIFSMVLVHIDDVFSDKKRMVKMIWMLLIAIFLD
jgi:hypothetical protein